MLTLRVQAIVNPHAGHGLAGKRWPHILAMLRKNGYEVMWRLTKRHFHAYYIAQDAVKQGAKLIMSVGGEGTFNEIINGVLSIKSKGLPTFAMIPIGTGTDLSRTLKIPKDHHKVVEIIKKGKTKLLDIGRMVFKAGNKTWRRYFVNASDAGLGGNVARITNHIPKHLGGFLTFLLSSLVALITFKPIKADIWIDGKFVDNPTITIVGALNGQYFGGGMHAAPMANIEDGVMEFIYVKDTNIFKFVSKVLAKVYKAEHLKYKNVYGYRGKQLKIRSEKLFLVDVDGEEEKASEVTLSVVPKAIRIIVP